MAFWGSGEEKVTKWSLRSVGNFIFWPTNNDTNGFFDINLIVDIPLMEAPV